MRKKISLFALYGVLLWGAFANYTLISHPEKRLTAYYRTHAEEGYYSVNDKETDVPATMMKLTGINIAVVLLGAIAFLAGGFLFSAPTPLLAPSALKDKNDPDDDDIGNKLDHYFEDDTAAQKTINIPKFRSRPKAKRPKIKIGRLAFLGWFVGWAALSIGWGYAFGNLITVSYADPGEVAFEKNAIILFVILPSCIACLFIYAFRFRSMGYSGWMALWALLPVFSLFVTLGCLLMPPSEKPKPLGPGVLFYLLLAIGVIIVGMLAYQFLVYAAAMNRT